DDRVDQAPRPDLASFLHPAGRVFRDPLPGGLNTAIFPHRWKLDPHSGASGSQLIRLSSGEPLLVERGYGLGRVIASAVPLDASWGTNLPRLPDFVRLMHELMYFLAGARGGDLNLDPPQTIAYMPQPYEPPGPLSMLGPDGKTRTIAVTNWPAMIEG